jgi:hypothetical protein
MPNSRTIKLLADHLRRDDEHFKLLCSALERRCEDLDRHLVSYDDEQKEHIFKKLFNITRQPYTDVDTEDKIMPFLISDLGIYRDGASVHSTEIPNGNVDLAWKTVIFNDAAKLCRIVREAEHMVLDGKIYKPPTPKSRPANLCQ